MTPTQEVFFCFDFGTKRIGVAVGQIITHSANALSTLRLENHKIPWSELDSLIQQWRPDAFVVGLPLNKDGTTHAITDKVTAFTQGLKARYHLPVDFMDERLSSIEAKHLIQQQGSDRNKGDIDKLAAKLILESWFRHRAESGN